MRSILIRAEARVPLHLDQERLGRMRQRGRSHRASTTPHDGVLTPGQVATPKQEELFDEATKAAFESLIPRGRMGRPEEIASIALFVASDDSTYVNGLDLPVASIPVDELMSPEHFGFLANLVTQSYPASNLITRRTLGWDPAQPGLLADLDNGHYFPAVTATAHDDVATLNEFVQGGDGAVAMVDVDAVWREAETLRRHGGAAGSTPCSPPVRAGVDCR